MISEELASEFANMGDVLARMGDRLIDIATHGPYIVKAGQANEDPEHEHKFIVSSTGRRIVCTECGHQWLQVLSAP